MIKNIIQILFIILILQGCSIKEEEKYSFVAMTIPPLYDKEKGGYLVPSVNYEYGSKIISQFGDRFGSIIKTHKNDGLIEEPLRSLWKIVRNPDGHRTNYSSCGKEPKRPIYIVELGKEKRERDWEIYKQKDRKVRNCISKIKEKYNSKYTTEYFYARMPQDYKLIYPKTKSPRHASWQITLYNGRVNDLSPKAIPDKYKNNLNELRSHKCQKWGSPICRDLPGKDENIYYSIREELYHKTQSDAKYSTSTASLSDVRVSQPLDWHEIKGIRIDKTIYDYLFERCKSGWKFCHLNDYKGDLTPEQKEYLENTKWSQDKRWTIKDKIVHKPNRWK
jgi:hypothetical protein